MDEKTIFEFRVFKTADGFRVEMNGDEEQMHGFRFGRGMRHFGRHFGHWGQHGGHGWPRWERRWQRAWQSWCDESESEPEEKSTSTGETKAQTL